MTKKCLLVIELSVLLYLIFAIPVIALVAYSAITATMYVGIKLLKKHGIGFVRSTNSEIFAFSVFWPVLWYLN